MKKLGILIVALTLAACMASVSTAETWDLTGDFSTTANPNGPWSNGVYLDGDGTYTWEYFQNWAGMEAFAKWGNPGEDLNAGAIFYNPSAVDHIGGTQFLRPGQVAIFPANLGWGYAPYVRWTAPSDMTVSIDALFTGQDEVTTDVHILVNGDMDTGEAWGDPIFTGTHLLDANLDGNYGCPDLEIPQSGTVQSAAYTGTISVTAGDYIDFVVGYGSNHFYGGDLTAMSATITEVPEPASLCLLGCALLGLSAYTWRKRKSSRFS